MQVREKLLTSGEVARLCGYSSSAVLQWIRNGKLPAYSSPGGQYRVAPPVLAQFLKTHGMQVPEALGLSDQPRVLVVDDEKVVRDFIVAALRQERADWQVETAQNGVDGCLKIPLFKPGVIVLDLLMPELDGVELVRSVRRNGELGNTKILIVTGHPDNARLQSALDAGADDWMAKPLQVFPLLHRIENLMDTRRESAPLQGECK